MAKVCSPTTTMCTTQQRRVQPRTIRTAQGRYVRHKDDSYGARATRMARGPCVRPKDDRYCARTSRTAPGRCLQPKDDAYGTLKRQTAHLSTEHHTRAEPLGSAPFCFL